MATIFVVYDSKTGNTARMASAIAEGAKSAGAEVVVHKLGEKFQMDELSRADAILIGSPTHYSSTTSEMRHFLTSLDELRKEKKLSLKGKIGAGFGSYGWSGEALERITGALKILGLTVKSPALKIVEAPAENDLAKCRDFGKAAAQAAVSKTKK
jgi:flavorubredoxin